MNELTLLGALVIGLLGSSHCIFMCGGLCSAVSANPQGEKKDLHLLSYNIGRLITYALLGAVFGLIGGVVVEVIPQMTVILRSVAGLLLVAMGLYLTRWWMGLTLLEKLGAKLFAPLQPLSKKLLPINSHPKAFSLGMLWGLLPCGLVYSTLSWSLALSDWRQSSLLMLAFGVGTLPAMLTLGVSQKKILGLLFQKNFRSVIGVAIIGMGILTFATPWLHFSAGHHQHGTVQHGTIKSADEEALDHTMENEGMMNHEQMSKEHGSHH
jgi:sulfite exporter TauE/SafE